MVQMRRLEAGIDFKDPETRRHVFNLARSGNQDALDYLQAAYSMKVFTQVELDRINKMVEAGMTINQAITQLREETGHVQSGKGSAEGNSDL